MSEFDEWYFDAKQHNTEGFNNRDFFEAGAQSKQAEIDSINTDLNHAFATVERQAKEIDELQKRNEQAIESLKLVNHALLYEHIDHIINLLDGTTNEQ